MSDLIIYPQDLTLFLRIILIPFLFEFFRIVIGSLYLFTSLLFLPIPSASLGYFFVGQSSKVNQLEKEKLEIQFELAQIKSIQLELVRHSKLERKMIKIDKEIEGLKANQIPKEKKFKSSVNIARGVIYLLSGIYFSSAPLVLISPQVFWPFGWVFFTSNETIALYAWFVILLGAASFRHLLRSGLLLIATPASFP